MIISPKTIVSKEILKSLNLPFDKKQIQQNGIDLRLDEVSSLSGLYVFSEGISRVPTDSEFKVERMEEDKDGLFWFKRGCAYSLLLFETAFLPENTVAMVYGRSSLNRNGILVRGSIYDSGFRGRVGATLYTGVNCAIQRKTRIAQIVFFEADSASVYKGQYQMI